MSRLCLDYRELNSKIYPVVPWYVFGKQDGMLRLCVDYRKLNSKTNPVVLWYTFGKQEQDYSSSPLDFGI